MLLFLSAMLAAGTIILLLAALYFLFLTLAGLFYRPKPTGGEEPQSRVAILVPAHDEEQTLPALLESLAGLQYPRRLYDVFVVADNCSDATLLVAQGAGAFAFERRDIVNLGKGYALRWLLQRVRTMHRSYDAYVLLDADCTISPNFLAALDARFQAGSGIVQSYYTVSNPFETPVSALRYIALVLKHYVRPRGRQRLGLSCGLFGTGMGFKREVLEDYDWDSFTLAEDIELFMKMTDKGVRVDFASEATVWTQMPAALREAKSQNLRWETGRLRMAFRYAPRFLAQGLVKGQVQKLDAAIEQLVPPLSITAVLALGVAVLCLFTGRWWLIAPSSGAVAALSGHVIIGLVSAHVPVRVYGALLHVPRFVAWKFLVYGAALLPVRRQWVRTERPQR